MYMLNDWNAIGRSEDGYCSNMYTWVDFLHRKRLDIKNILSYARHWQFAECDAVSETVKCVDKYFEPDKTNQLLQD